jgi:hypothetical protein
LCHVLHFEQVTCHIHASSPISGAGKATRLTNDFRELAVKGGVERLKGDKAHGDIPANEEFAALSGDKPRVLGKTRSWVLDRVIG